MGETIGTLLVFVFIGVGITGAWITAKNKKREVGERREQERRWEEQIRAGKTPINRKLRERNRNDFFVYMYRQSTNGQVMDLESIDFGDARDALLLACQLREKAKITCVIRRSKKNASYVVLAQNIHVNKLNKFRGDRNGVYEFENLAFAPTEKEMSDDESETVAEVRTMAEEPAQIKAPEYTNGEEYERYIAAIMGALGFEDIKMTPTTGDFGADIIAIKDGVKCCVQCKMYSNPVGISAVQEVIGAKAHYGCAAAMVVTNSTFTTAAKQLAAENDVILSENVT